MRMNRRKRSYGNSFTRHVLSVVSTKTRCKIFLCGSLGINITRSWFKPRQTNIDPWWCRCSWRPPWPNGRLCAISLRCLTRLYQATTNYFQPHATANYCKLPSSKNSALLLCDRIVFYCTTTTPPCVCLCAQDVCSPLRKPFMSPDPPTSTPVSLYLRATKCHILPFLFHPGVPWL